MDLLSTAISQGFSMQQPRACVQTGSHIQTLWHSHAYAMHTRTDVRGTPKPLRVLHASDESNVWCMHTSTDVPGTMTPPHPRRAVVVLRV